MLLFDLIVTLPLFRVPRYAWAAIMRITSVRWACVVACSPWAFLALVYFEKATPIEAAFASLSQNVLARMPTGFGALNIADASDAPFFFIMFQALSALASLSFYSTIWLGPWHILAALSTQDASSGETSHGSAEWGDVDAAVRAGNIWPKDYVGGLLLGRMWQKRFPKAKDPRYRVCRHVLACAPTGAGKGVGCVIPNLLAYPGSVVCLDVKGENIAVTAQARRDMGQDVWCLDPFGITDAAGHSLNWLDAIDLNCDSCVGDAAALPETLVVRGASQDMHTARYLSEMLGQATLQVASSSKSQSWSHRGDASSGTNEGTSPHARLLMTPDEVRRMSAHQVLVFEQGQPPQRLLRLDYRTDPESCAALPQNPMYAAPGRRLPHLEGARAGRAARKEDRGCQA